VCVCVCVCVFDLLMYVRVYTDFVVYQLRYIHNVHRYSYRNTSRCRQARLRRHSTKQAHHPPIHLTFASHCHLALPAPASAALHCLSTTCIDARCGTGNTRRTSHSATCEATHPIIHRHNPSACRLAGRSHATQQAAHMCWTTTCVAASGRCLAC
jgi:hypothetical protein